MTGISSVGRTLGLHIENVSRDVAQLVECALWEREVPSPSLGIPTEFSSVKVYSEYRLAMILRPRVQRFESSIPDLSVPAFDLRMTADDDGIYVVDANRGKHIGSILLKTAIEIAHRTGSRRFMVRHGEKQSSWYKKLGGHEVLGGFLFDLSK